MSHGTRRSGDTGLRPPFHPALLTNSPTYQPVAPNAPAESLHTRPARSAPLRGPPRAHEILKVSAPTSLPYERRVTPAHIVSLESARNPSPSHAMSIWISSCTSKSTSSAPAAFPRELPALPRLHPPPDHRRAATLPHCPTPRGHRHRRVTTTQRTTRPRPSAGSDQVRHERRRKPPGRQPGMMPTSRFAMVTLS